MNPSQSVKDHPGPYSSWSRLSESNRRPSHYEIKRRAPHDSTEALSPAETRLTRDTTTVAALYQLQPNCTALLPTDAELLPLQVSEGLPRHQRHTAQIDAGPKTGSGGPYEAACDRKSPKVGS